VKDCSMIRYRQQLRKREMTRTIEADRQSIFPERPDEGYATPDRSPTYYERDPRLRRLAIEIHGTSCQICGFDFCEFYGSERGKDYIEVHHIVPIAAVPESGATDPETDMIVVCANCHRMLHRRRGSTLHPDELRSAIQPQTNQYGLPR
jgi:predicted HNH restriction endonuclease